VSSRSPYYSDDLVTIYNADAADVLPTLTAGSVSMVLADPPYPAEFQHLYALMGVESSRLLKHGGHLVTLCGHHQVPAVIRDLEPHLRYWWIGGMRHTSQKRLPGKWVAVAWKPALWYVKDRRLSEDVSCPVDLMTGSKDKDHHEWGQGISWSEHWIDRLTKPGDLILDPFMGAGTNIVAARNLGRRVIGIELEERHCATTVARLGQDVLFRGIA
jgi:site-specific DNA-methyltransferase (adenine-specific)